MTSLVLLLLALNDPWFPLDDGAVWSYSGDWTVEVDGSEKIGASTCTILKSTSGGRVERRWISVTSDGVWVHRIDDRKLDRPAMLLRLPLRAGDRWDALGLSYKVDGADTAAGHECMKVTASGRTAHGNLVIESWYARGVGLVKEVRTVGGVATLSELRAHTAKLLCPSCRAKILPSAKFCHECGATLAEKRAAETARVAHGTYHHPRLGIRVRADEKKFELRTSDFTFGWGGTECEIRAKDGIGGGVITHYISGMRAEAFADWREGSWKTTEGVRKLRRIKSETLKRKSGTWVRREFVLEYEFQEYHYLEVFANLGSRNLELALWVPDTLWDDVKDDFYAISDTLEFERVWSCPGCENEVKPEDTACGCGMTLVSPNEELNRLLRKHGIQIVVDPGKIYPRKTASNNAITAKAAPKKAIEDFCALLASELAPYPAEFFQQLGLERIVLCRDLRRDGTDYGGLSEYDTDTIHFEITQGKDLKHYQSSKIHHELFHFIDYRDDATIERDDAWEKLNPSGFKYDANRSGFWGFDDKNAGFLNTYSMTAVSEDKAEIYGHLAVRAEQLEERALTDKVIRRKIQRMKELVRAYCPKLDDEFWNGLRD